MKTAHQFTTKLDLAASRSDTDGVRVLLIQARAQAVSVNGELLSFSDGSTLRVIGQGELVIPYESEPDFRPEPSMFIKHRLSVPRR